MPVLFGDTRANGKIRVWRTLHQVDGKPVDPKDYPEGYAFEDMPEFPAPEPGIYHIWLFDPKTEEHTFEEEERPWTPEEIMQVEVPDMKVRLGALEKATGAGGNPGEKGIARRLDDLETRIKVLEEKSPNKEGGYVR